MPPIGWYLRAQVQVMSVQQVKVVERDLEEVFMRMPRVLDLFCGAGGLSLGFEKMGFQVLGGVDHDSNAMETYKRNFPSALSWREDLNEPSEEFETWLRSIRGDVDVVVGGPPCQGFSIAGKRLIDDPRNLLYKKYMDVVAIVMPAFVVIENVPNIASMNKGEVKKQIIEDLSLLGYAVTVETLNASHFGVPQARRRTFFVGHRLESWSFKFPIPTTRDSVITCAEALSDLPSLDHSATGVERSYARKPQSEYQSAMRGVNKIIHNHELVRHTDRTKEIIALVPDGGNFKDLPVSLQGTRRVKIAWTRMNSARPSFTIDAGHNHHFHYEENRVPSVRECARIQSFPDNFVFDGPRTSQYRQVGNAVPPLVASSIASEVMKGLRSV
jgi:DNA (cytosine-5)-methyltransferase 1